MQVRDLIYLLQKEKPDADILFGGFVNENGTDGEIVDVSTMTDNFTFADVFSGTVKFNVGEVEDEFVTILIPPALFDGWTRRETAPRMKKLEAVAEAAREFEKFLDGANLETIAQNWGPVYRALHSDELEMEKTL